jgi:transcriptional regulator with XRE-family HTH domain
MRHALTLQQRMNLASRLAQFRKRKGLTQAQLADALDLHISQVKRYEAGTSQPSVDGLKRIALLLSVSTDELIFGEDQRSPAEHLRLHFEAIAKLPDDDQRTVIDVIEGLILKSEARRWSSTRGKSEQRASG